MSAALGTPEGGISQPASGKRAKKATIAAIAGERMSPALERMFAP
jgi:hypothetical protein